MSSLLRHLAIAGRGGRRAVPAERAAEPVQQPAAGDGGVLLRRGRRADRADRAQRADLARARGADGGRRLHDREAAGRGRHRAAAGAVLVGATVAGAVAGLLAGAAAARLRGPYLAGRDAGAGRRAARDRAALPGLPRRLRWADGVPADAARRARARRSRSSAGRRASPAWRRCWTYVVLANLERSRLGRDFRAVRDDEVAPELAGLYVARMQVLAFVVSAACAGLAGGLLVVVTSLAAPGRVPAGAVGRAAHRRDPRRAREPGRRGLGRGRADPDPDLGRRRQRRARPVDRTCRPTSRSRSTGPC